MREETRTTRRNRENLGSGGKEKMLRRRRGAPMLEFSAHCMPTHKPLPQSFSPSLFSKRPKKLGRNRKIIKAIRLDNSKRIAFLLRIKFFRKLFESGEVGSFRRHGTDGNITVGECYCISFAVLGMGIGYCNAVLDICILVNFME